MQGSGCKKDVQLLSIGPFFSHDYRYRGGSNHFGKDLLHGICIGVYETCTKSVQVGTKENKNVL